MAWSCKRDTLSQAASLCLAFALWLFSLPASPMAGCHSGYELRFLTAFCSNPSSRRSQWAHHCTCLSLRLLTYRKRNHNSSSLPGTCRELKHRLNIKHVGGCLMGGLCARASVSCHSAVDTPHSRGSTCSGALLQICPTSADKTQCPRCWERASSGSHRVWGRDAPWRPALPRRNERWGASQEALPWLLTRLGALPLVPCIPVPLHSPPS